MRHVSRTHRVALDWLFDRINWDPKIQIKDVDTNNQLAEMLTKGSFTRDEWDHLLHLLNIMNFFDVFLQPFSFEQKAECHVQRELRKARPKKVQQWRNRDRWMWCQGTSWSQSKTLRKIRTARGNQELDQSYVSPSVRKLMRNKSRDPTAYSQSGDKMTLYFWAPGNWSEVMTYKSEGRG